MSTPLSIRLSDALKKEFKIVSEQTGMKQEDFVATLLASFKEKQAETDTGSPVYRERAKVTQALSQIERVVIGFLEIAHNDKETQILKAQEQVEQINADMAELKENLKEEKAIHLEVSETKTALEEKLTSLEEQAKSLKALQDAWTEKETALNSRLADLDAETREARKLKNELAETATTIMEQKNIIALTEQREVTTQETLTDIKARLKNKDTSLEQLRHDLQGHAEEKGALTAKIEFQAQKIDVLELKLAKLKKTSETK